MNIYTIDFETESIVNGSPTMPIPVGVSIKYNDEPSHYYAWGHPTENNYTEMQVTSILSDIFYDEDSKILCHNAKFDIRVAMEHFGLPYPEPSRIMDTMIMAYLLNPREKSLSLKPLTSKYCGMPPEEQDELHNWIIKNVPGSKSEPGAFIYLAPGKLVGRYAESDTDRTFILYNVFKNRIFVEPNGDHQTITDAFNREMALMPIVIDMEQRGVHIADNVDVERESLERMMILQDNITMAYSGNNKPGSLAMYQALLDRGFVDKSKLRYTPTGRPSFKKEYIDDIISDKELSKTLVLRSRLQKLISTYVRPFSESANKYKGKFYPYYNQTRGDNDLGTRTGRFSSNIQQLPKTKSAGKDFSGEVIVDDLPFVREFIIPAPGKMLIKRDFSGQELRVLAHYAEGRLLKAYQENPALDPHEYVHGMILDRTGRNLGRTPTKVINFLKIYGGGPANLAGMLGMSLDQAKEFFAAYDEAFPEPKQLIRDVENLARTGKLIRTWGGRSYDVEISSEGKSLYYKLVNVLIQGSSADMTKEAMIRYYSHPDHFGNIFMQVHDEIVVETDAEHMHADMAILKWAMDEIPGWDVPLMSDGAFGYSFGKMEKYDD